MEGADLVLDQGIWNRHTNRSLVSPSEVTEALKSIEIEEGSTVLVHPDAIVAAQFAGISPELRLDALIEAVQAAIGSSGTLIMPTFSYSFTKGERFDVRRTPSAVGMVSERFRTLPRVARSADPIFSFAARGPLAERLCDMIVKECFGQDSVFALLHRVNAQIVDLGCSMTRGGTFVHYVEVAHGVDYRYKKEFSGTVVFPDGRSIETSVVYHVRDLTRKSAADLRRLQNRLAQENRLRSVDVGRSRIMAVTTNDLFNTACKMLDEDPVSLIAEGAEN
jgi:aminoglycoside 3-N-acetyltransferase